MIRLLLGAAIGAIIGVLFAPRPGEETREDLKRRLAEMQGMHDPSGMHRHDLESRGRDFATNAGEEIRQRLDEARSKVVELVRKVEDGVDAASKQASTAIEEAETEITRGDSTSTDESDTSEGSGAKGVS